jgi:hypothetical protein
MKANIGSYDCAVRFVAGMVVLNLSHHGLGWWSLIGLIPLVTSLFGFCPAYRLFGVDTYAWELAHEAAHHPPRHRSRVRKL